MNRFTISQRLLSGFAALIFLFIINAVISISVLNNNQNKAQYITTVTEPSINAVNTFSTLLLQSKMLTTNWVYLRSKEEDKAALKALHNTQYPAFKKQLASVMALWEDKEQIKKMNALVVRFEKVLETEKGIMSSLSTFESYDDAMAKLDAESTLDEAVLIPTSEIMVELEKLKTLKLKEKKDSEESLASSSTMLTSTVIGLAIILVVLSIVIALFLAKSISKPILYVKDLMNQLSKGKLIDVASYNGKDEIGEMIHSLGEMVHGLKLTSEFARSVGDSKFHVDYHVLSEHDELGTSLITMRDNLMQAAEEDKRRSWATNGLAEIAIILRSNFTSTTQLYDEILKFVIHYVGANQGVLFERMENQGEDIIKLVSCYAYDRKKHIGKELFIGEGLAGQCVLENDTIFLTDVPENYITITSGLGDAAPRCVLLVPLKINEHCEGVLELAAFKVLEPYEVAFVEKLAESIASTISSVKINERTKILLEESQMQSEQLRTQEEEVRQNLEELHATQEEMQRRQDDMQRKLLDAQEREDELNRKLSVFKSVHAEQN